MKQQVGSLGVLGVLLIVAVFVVDWLPQISQDRENVAAILKQSPRTPHVLDRGEDTNFDNLIRCAYDKYEEARTGLRQSRSILPPVYSPPGE